MLSMANRFKKLLNFSPKTLFGIRSCSTTTTGPINPRYYNNKGMVRLILDIFKPTGDRSGLKMSTVLDDWVEKGNEIRLSEAKQMVNYLRHRKRFNMALEVSEWLNKRELGMFTPADHAVRVHLIGKVYGFLEAEKYFNNLSDQDKNNKSYGVLLHCYVEKRQTEKALSHFQLMKEKGIVSSSGTLNDIMLLYRQMDQHEKVHDVFKEMKKDGVRPDNSSYRICISSYGDKMDIKGMESVLEEMEKNPSIVMDWNTYAVVANCYIKAKLNDKANDALKKAENCPIGKNVLAYNHLISLYACLGNKAGILGLWDIRKTAGRMCTNIDYTTVVKSLAKMFEFEEAEKLLVEWESSKNSYDFQVPCKVIYGYLNKGLCDKAQALLDHLIKEGKATTPDSWGCLALGYLKKGDTEKALSCMDTAFSLPLDHEQWKMDQRFIKKLLDGIGEKASVEDVESFMGKLKTFVEFDREMYHTLIEAYIRGGKEVSRVLASMRADNYEEDQETKKILGMQQNKV